ncbi:MAG: hypothetical protein KGL39_33290 [Patescibacteria group bacterium]|nr:hypothetical protein [Patescibacteria group bacterium]
MKKMMTVILRFRDLVTHPGGTIVEHQRIADQYGYVWWGWWKRQTESYPDKLFSELHAKLKKNIKGLPAFVFDTGAEKIYLTRLYKLAVAPHGGVISTPEASRSPAYYQNGAYPAWFKFGGFTERRLTDIVISHHSFPTNAELDAQVALKGLRIEDTKKLRLMDVTLYVVNVDVNSIPKSY